MLVEESMALHLEDRRAEMKVVACPVRALVLYSSSAVAGCTRCEGKA